MPGNSKSLWDAVNKAKDINTDPMPDVLFENNQKLNKTEHATAFANFFNNKVKSIINETKIDPNVYNGKNKVNPPPPQQVPYDEYQYCGMLKDHKNQKL